MGNINVHKVDKSLHQTAPSTSKLKLNIQTFTKAPPIVWRHQRTHTNKWRLYASQTSQCTSKTAV